MTRPSWDEVWSSFAMTISKRSIDPRSKVGAVIVTADNTQVLSVGYNGDQAGGPNEIESIEPGQSGCLHAEFNAIIKLDYNNPKKKKMYVTMSPCKMCAKAIINAGVNEVVYSEKYRDESGIQLLLNSNVPVRYFPARQDT
jgi:dCMP deaminase